MISVKSAKLFCKDDISKIENYEKAMSDTSQTWQCHHRTEIWWNCTRQDLIENECYYHRKACELIFLTPAEHRRLHNMHMSESTRKKISETKKGQPGIWKGKVGPMKGKHHSEETKKKMSKAQKGENHHNFGKHASEETRKKMSKAQKGRTSPVKDMTWKLIDGKRVYFPKEVK